MAESFEFDAKQHLAAKQLKAAHALEDAGLREQSAALHWTALRTFLFSQLAVRGIKYSSTSNAILLLFSTLSTEAMRSDLMSSYLIGTMAEWDESFSVSKEQLHLLKCKCENIRQSFYDLPKGDQRGI
ncbi:hypothetical protein [Methylobacterium sp. V23]|uniref:hypothetical protein n=1 Tax=Methylobacterium sp. V23 TaxID=2044878 RepID=UPI0015E198EC|nr:hypothetical protein [Methylobacterium sp. V23]